MCSLCSPKRPSNLHFSCELGRDGPNASDVCCVLCELGWDGPNTSDVCCVAGNWEGEGRFKMWFNRGGAIEFGQAMLHAGRLGEPISCYNNCYVNVYSESVSECVAS